jgi:hypothetical protein
VDRLEAEWDADWRKQALQTALDRVKKRIKPEMYQVFDLVVNKGWPALKVARRLHVNLPRVYYSQCKVSAEVRREIKKLEKNGI